MPAIGAVHRLYRAGRLRLIRRGERGIGPGLLIGWAAGILGLVVGTILIAYSVLPFPNAVDHNIFLAGLANGFLP